jgi:fatty acid desaturase
MSAATPADVAIPDLDADARTNAAWHTKFSRDEIQELVRVESWRGWLSIALDWAVIAASLAMVAVWTHPLTVIAAFFLIGARQLGLAILMHEASHRTLLADKRWNDFAGNWLCAYPIWTDVHAYRPYHLQHHAKNWTKDDPDIGLVLPFPITKSSLRRKIWRDLSGQTGRKFARGSWKRSIARWRAGDANGRRACVGFVVTNLLLLALLAASGHPWLYLVWAGAWLTTNTLVTRIRSIAEHAMIPDPADPLRNTRTTLASWWERLLLAPNRVNYHLEHHLLMTVPLYKLPRLHRLLDERGLLDGACVTRGYADVLRRAASKPGGTATATSDREVRVPPF